MSDSGEMIVLVRKSKKGEFVKAHPVIQWDFLTMAVLSFILWHMN